MTVIQKKVSGRIVSTVPKDEALNAQLDDREDVSWHVRSRDRLEVRLEDQDTERPTTRIRYDSYSGSYLATIPKHLAHAMHFVGGEVEWDYVRGNLVLEVTSRGGTSDE